MASKLYVGNLPYSVDDDKLGELFKEYGTVVSAVVISDKYTQRSKGFGFVELSNDDEAKAAIDALNESEVDGRKIVVNVARPREER